MVSLHFGNGWVFESLRRGANDSDQVLLCRLLRCLRVVIRKCLTGSNAHETERGDNSYREGDSFCPYCFHHVVDALLFLIVFFCKFEWILFSLSYAEQFEPVAFLNGTDDKFRVCQLLWRAFGLTFLRSLLAAWSV